MPYIMYHQKLFGGAEQMAMTESIELLGKGLYGGKIPDTLTLQSIPTVSELEYISAEDFDQTMIEKILPKAVKEEIDFGSLLEVDYNWILRCLRILNYGPYYTTNSILCPNCGRTYGEYRVNLNSIECKPIPGGFTGRTVISRDEFLDFNGDVEIKLLTIRETLAAYKDTAFNRPDGTVNRSLARYCYMIKGISGQTGISPVEVRLKIEKEMSSADFMILKDVIDELTDFGLRSGGYTVCPKCHSKEAVFIALVNDRFFRPTLGDLRQWKADKRERGNENSAGSKTDNVRKHS